jgi:opacity protein-like surface antigen
MLAGSGALDFRPTNNPGGYVYGAQAQARPVFLYGGGANYDLAKHLMVRLEYRGFVYQAPDFDRIAMHTGSATHMAQPSAGIVYKF